MMEFDRPVIVTGAPRSGKSLLTKILRQSPGFGFLMEPLAIWDIGMTGRPDDRRTADEATDRVRARIRAACRDHLEKLGKQRYLDDLAYHALRVPFLHRVMPEARIIHVIRSGTDIVPEMLFGWRYRDTVGRAFARRRKTMTLTALPRLGLRFAKNYLMSRLSGRRSTWGPRVPGLAEFAASHSTAEVAAFQWRRMIEIARQDLAALPPGSVLEVRFDGMIADPGGTAGRVAEFCGIDDAGPLRRFAGELLDPDFQFERRIEPEEDEWAAIRGIIDPLQRELGYLPAGTAA